jgi:hypothetical protein
MGLIGFLPTKGMLLLSLSHVRETDGLANGAIGGVDYTPEERRKIAKEYVPLLARTRIVSADELEMFGFKCRGLIGRSRDWCCAVCKVRNIDLLPDRGTPSRTNENEKDIDTTTAPVQLSFGYQKDQGSSSGQATPSTTGLFPSPSRLVSRF